jgi:hypothetical protein
MTRMTSPSRKLRLTALAVALSASVPSAGCIGSYGSPARQAATGPGRARNPADTGPLAVKLQGPRGQEPFFASTLQAVDGRPVVVATATDAPPAKGRFVAITVTEVPNSAAVQVWGTIAAITAFIIPVWSKDSGYDLTFATFVEGRPAATYRYTVREQLFVWIALLPAIWVNFLTRSRSDAFSDAIRQFVADSKNDGF